MALLAAEAGQDRKMAALTLGYIGTAAVQAVEALTQAQHDPDPAVGKMASLALWRINPTPREAQAA